MSKKHEHRVGRIVEFCPCGATREDGADWVERGKGLNAAAQTLSLRRSPAQRKAGATKGAEARWAVATAEERRAFMARIAKAPRPSRRIEDRCPCGKFSRTLAEKRGHICKTDA